MASGKLLLNFMATRCVCLAMLDEAGFVRVCGVRLRGQEITFSESNCCLSRDSKVNLF